VAEPFELDDQRSDVRLVVARAKPVRSEIMAGLIRAEHVVRRNQDGVGEPYLARESPRQAISRACCAERQLSLLYGDVEEFQGEIGDEESFTVGDTAAVAGTWRYRYDFGDGWDHDIRVGQRLASVGLGKPHCVDGARACPPEDCGGAPATSTCWRFWPTLPTPTPSMWPRPTRSSSSTTDTPGSAPGADRRRR
jgi:hypothetical protein